VEAAGTERGEDYPLILPTVSPTAVLPPQAVIKVYIGIYEVLEKEWGEAVDSRKRLKKQ